MQPRVIDPARAPLVLAAAATALAAAAAIVGADVEATRADRERAPQVAVLRDGFATLVDDGVLRIAELGRDGARRGEDAIALASEPRLVGTAAGPALGWLHARRVHLALVKDGGLVQRSEWGKAPRQLCEGAASNERRFAVGWLEADDSVWIVHGPLAAKRDVARDEVRAARVELGVAAGLVTWCAIASADKNVAMVWRGGDLLSLMMCTAKRCGPLGARVKLDPAIAVLATGCVGDACVLAMRGGSDGPVELALVHDHGKRSKWTRRLADAAPGTAVSAAGIGDRAVAVGYVSADGAVVVRVGRDGAVSPVWRAPGVRATPSLAWAGGRLLVATRAPDGELATVVVDLAR